MNRLAKPVREALLPALISQATRMCGLVLVLVLTSFLLPSCSSAETSLRSEITPQSGGLDDLFLFTVVFEGAQEKAQPQLSTNTDFNVVFLGPKTSVSIINGVIRSQQSFVYQLSPRRTGTLHTPEAQVLASGQQLSAPPITVFIRGNDAQAQPSPTRGKEPIFMNQTASPSSVFVGQQIVNSITVYTKVNLQGIKIDDSTADGFWQEVISDGTNSRKTINGEEYATAGISRALFPLRAGTLNIPRRTGIVKAPVSRSGNPLSGLDPFSDDFFENFFQRSIVQDKKIASQDLAVEVKPLPVAPKELIQYMGGVPIVGSTHLSVQYSDSPMKVGESKNVSVVITSDGNLNPLKSVPLNAPQGVKIYEGQTQTRRDTQGYKLLTEKTFSFSVVALQPGVLRISGANLAYFDPQTETFKLSTTPDISVIVTGSPQGTSIARSAQGDQQAVAPTSNPNLVPTLSPAPFAPPLSYREKSLWESISERLSLQLSLLILSATIGLVFLCSLGSKAASAKAPTRKTAEQIKSASSLSEFEECLRTWVTAALPGANSNATYDELRALIKTRGSKTAVKEPLLSLLDEVELARYNPLKTSANLDELKERFASILKSW